MRWELVWNTVAAAREFWMQNALVIIGGVLIIMLCVAASPSRLKEYRVGRMLRKAKMEHVLNVLTYDFVSAVEERVASADITRSDATEVYRILKERFPVQSLFPAPELMKEQIKRRLGKHIEPNFPDKVVKPKRRNMLTPIERVVM